MEEVEIFLHQKDPKHDIFAMLVALRNNLDVIQHPTIFKSLGDVVPWNETYPYSSLPSDHSRTFGDLTPQPSEIWYAFYPGSRRGGQPESMSSERRYSEPWSNTLSVENGTEGADRWSQKEERPMVGRGGMRLPFALICVRISESWHIIARGQ
jgi:hypothetical protein